MGGKATGDQQPLSRQIKIESQQRLMMEYFPYAFSYDSDEQGIAVRSRR
jgi:hypothetical protein